MISFEEFVLRAHVERQSLHAWIAAGWIVPPQTDPEPIFSDIDLARAQRGHRMSAPADMRTQYADLG